MTTLHAPAKTPPSLARSDFYLTALLVVVVLSMAALAGAMDSGAGSLPPARWLALAPLIVAAYSPRGLQAALVLTVFFVSALLPAALSAWATPAFTPLLVDLLAYGVMLGLVSYLAATTAAFLRTRQTLSGAVRDWEALMARTSELEEVAAFVVQQAGATAPAQAAVLLLRHPVDGLWEILGSDGAALERFTMAARGGRLSLAHWLVDQGQPLILDSLSADRRFLAPSNEPGQTVDSLLAQPLYSQDGSLLAMITLINKLDGVFDQADCAALAEQAQASQRAIEQAGQYARTDHDLTRRVQQLAALQHAAHALNATMDPQVVVDEALACAMAITGAEAGLVSVDLPGLGRVYRANNVQVASDVIRQAADLAQAARQALLIRAADDSFHSLLDRPGPRLVAPIRRAGRTFGLILLESGQPLAFGEESLRAVASLADHAAVALDNTRLFREILREKRKSDEVIASIADALLTVGREGQVLTFNPAAEALTGWRAEEAAGHQVCEVLGCQQNGLCRENCPLAPALPGGQPVHHGEFVLRQRLGTQRVVTLDASPLPAGEGEEGGVAVLMRDVTEAWEMERMQRELIAAFSHELRTPLTIINTATEMLLAGEGGPRSIDDNEAMLLATLQTQTERLTGFADRIVDLARTEEQTLALAPLALGTLLEATVAQWRGSLGNRSLRLARPADEVWVLADGDGLQAVLDALIDNASKYTPPDTPIDLAVELASAGFATVAVSDRGPGIAASHQARLFDRFYRVDAGDAQRVYGHGLGLYLARNLAAQMGGQIWVESEQGRGSRFAFTLPLAVEESDEDPGD